MNDWQGEKRPFAVETLTHWEWLALRGNFNLADGHAHQAQNADQLAVIQNLPGLYLEAEAGNQTLLQNEMRNAFFNLACQDGQQGLNALFHYSASMSIDVVASYLGSIGQSVALVNPTFDNIPAILRRRGLGLVAMDEADLNRPAHALERISADAVFLVCPNNPTGFELTKKQFQELVSACHERNITLVVDFSFRFFSSLATWDQYEILRSSGVDFIALEDTGKTWPTLDLKAGIVLAENAIYDKLEQITDDYMLNISPFILTLLHSYISRETPAFGVSALKVSEANRTFLRESLQSTPLAVPLQTSKIPMEWVMLPEGWESGALCAWLHSRGVHVLPGPPFYWSNPTLGNHYVRIALMRPEEYFRNAVIRLVEALAEYRTTVLEGASQ